MCPLRLVECEFADVGCEVKVPQRDLTRHMTENAQHHLMSATLLNLRLTRELHQKMEEKDQQIIELKQQLNEHEAKLTEQSKGIAKTLLQQTSDLDIKHQRDLNAKLQQQTKDLDAKLQRQTKDLDAKLQQQTKDLEAKLQQQTKDLDAKFQQQTKDFDAKLQQQTKDLDAKLQQQTKDLDAKFQQQTEDFDAKLQQQTKDIDAKLQQQTRDLDTKCQRDLNTKLQQQTKDLGSKFQLQTRDLKTEIQQHASNLKAELQKQITSLDSKFQQQISDMNTKQTQDLDSKLKQQTKYLDIKLQQTTEGHQANIVRKLCDIELTLFHGLAGTCHEFTLTEFKQYQAKGEEGSWYSDFFYNRPGGYRFKLNIDTNGYSGARNTHLSVYLYAEEGEHDKDLQWSVSGEVFLVMLNQQGDQNHHLVIAAFNLQRNSSLCGIKREFYPLADLTYNAHRNTEYLMDDSLKFKLSIKIN